jgi:ATP-dependent Clp protease ATP-binding subunit ClpA
MFDRFTDRARQVIVLAQDEARGLKHNYIGTEHLLLGLLREPEGVARSVLESLGLSADAVRLQVIRIIGEGEGAAAPAGQIPFTPRAKKVLERALREGLSLGHNYIGTEHILLGLNSEEEGVAARVLREFGADSERIRDAVAATVPRMVRRPRPPRPAPWRRHARQPRRFGALAAAREEALEDGNYDLARKLLEIEIEERQKRGRSAGQPEAESGAS